MRIKNGTAQKNMKKSHTRNMPQCDFFPVLRILFFLVIPAFEENLYIDLEKFDWVLGVA